MSDESFDVPGFLEQDAPARDAMASREPRGLTSGTALSVLWWITDDDADGDVPAASEPTG
jgi:hypothetical protein